MNETTLLIAFIAFAFIALIAALVARKLSVRDIFDDTSISLVDSAPAIRDSFPAGSVSSSSKLPTSKNINSASRREKTHKIAKILSVVGAIILFTPKIGRAHV